MALRVHALLVAVVVDALRRAARRIRGACADHRAADQADGRTRAGIAAIADERTRDRAHRGAHPQPDHVNLAGLDKAEVAKVRKLAAILRIADALDREHREKVNEVSVSVDKKRVVLRLRGEHDYALEMWTVKRKAPLFEEVFDRGLEIEGPELPL